LEIFPGKAIYRYRKRRITQKNSAGDFTVFHPRRTAASKLQEILAGTSKNSVFNQSVFHKHRIL